MVGSIASSHIMAFTILMSETELFLEHRLQFQLMMVTDSAGGAFYSTIRIISKIMSV